MVSLPLPILRYMGAGHDIVVAGTSLAGPTGHSHPVILQMHDDDFPAHFLQDLLTQGSPATSSTPPVSSAQPVTVQAPLQHALLFQPVQRMLNVALMQLNCNAPGYPRVDPRRVLSAGMVVRRVARCSPAPGLNAVEDPQVMAAWSRNAAGQWRWAILTPQEADLDPDPTQRPPIKSGDPGLDSQLAAMVLATARTESTTPVFAAPPATCAALGRTVLYGVIPTASSESSDVQPQAPAISTAQLQSVLPSYLLSGGYSVPSTLAGTSIDARWLSDDYLTTAVLNAPGVTQTILTGSERTAIQQFTLAVRMLATVFGAFAPASQSQPSPVITLLNNYQVTFDPPVTFPGASVAVSTFGMGDYYAQANTLLLNYSAYPQTSSSSSSAPQLTLPSSWAALSAADAATLLGFLQTAAAAQSSNVLAPQGRFQDDTRVYRLRMFVRLKGDNPNCPPQLVWSDYSRTFYIAPWFATGDRTRPPISLPDPTSTFLKSAKPNCSFRVPGNLMGAMQGTSMSGLMSGAGGGTGLKLDWICGFNIPLITICAFFVLNIFLMLLNIVFFWLPIIKICIPFPAPSATEPDQ